MTGPRYIQPTTLRATSHQPGKDGALVLPHLSDGSNFLPAPKNPDYIDAEYVR